MKRKRGNKKGKVKKAPRPPPPPAGTADAGEAAVNLDSRTDSGGDRSNNEELGSTMEVNTPSSTGTDQPLNLASINPDGSIDKAAGKAAVGRVKVKLKTSKKIESQSDTDKSSLQLGLEQQGGVSDKMEDSGDSLPEGKLGVSGNVSKKTGSIKFKSSKIVDGLGGEKSGNAQIVGEDSLRQREPAIPYRGSQYNKEELDSALTVIKKVMKMDAAEPFNVPVNPEALGIPDYFDVIDTPMDFGTICNNLEKGDKYMNSEDVYRDVQYIWDNCYKYNNKGDYILDLMRRVKKNFMKYWSIAGLYTEQSKGPHGAEGFQGEEVAASSQTHVKGVQSKQKNKKRHGRRHKFDCLCAICVLKRRRKEREENERLAKGQIGVADTTFDQQFKQDDSSLVQSPLGGGESSSDMGESQDPDANTETEERGQKVKADAAEGQYSHVDKHDQVEDDDDDDDDDEEEEEEEEENDLDNQKNEKDEQMVQTQYADTMSEEPNGQSQPVTVGKAATVVLKHSLEGPVLTPHRESAKTVQQNKLKELQERRERAKILENFRFENPLLQSLCGSLFPENCESIWRGPHSLVHEGNARRSKIHTAIDSLMK